MTASCVIDVVTGADVVECLDASWDRQVAANPTATPFQTAGWCRAWIREAAGTEGASPVLLRVGQADGTRVSAGLQLHHDVGGPGLRPLTWPWADYHEAVGDAAECPDAASTLAEGIGRFLRQESARLDFPDLVPGGLLHEACVRLGAAITPSTPTAALDLRDAERVAEVLATGEIRMKGRRLARCGRVSTVHLADPGDVRGRLPTFFAMHAAQWRDRPDAVAPFDGGAVDRTYSAAVEDLDGLVVLSELRLDDETLAMYYGFLSRRRYWAYRTTFAQAWRRLSPGHQLVHAMITDFVRQDVETFDLMRGDYAYKHRLANRLSRNVRATWTGP